MTDAGVVSLLVQVPLVGLFVWYTFRLFAMHREERREWSDEWRKFFVAEREARKEGMSRLAEAMKRIGLALASHDGRVEEHAERLVRAIERKEA